MTVGFIGAGKAGTALGKYFAVGGVDVSGYYSRSRQSALESAELVSCKCRVFSKLSELVNKSDVIFITTDDGNIRGAAQELSVCGISLAGKLIAHVSGCLDSSVLQVAAECGAMIGSLHMMCALCDKFTAWQNLRSAVFTVEGDKSAVEMLSRLTEGLGNRIIRLPAGKKPLYHAASVMSSNFLNSLLSLSCDMLSRCGFDADTAEQAMTGLLLGAAENIKNKGLTHSLTGPVERNDIQTVTVHLSSLEGKERQIYILLSQWILEIAENRHPDRDYGELKESLSE